MATEVTIRRLTSSASTDEVTAYHAFVNSSPQGILYCKTWWLEATAPGRWEVLIADNASGIQAAWPLVYDENGCDVVMPPLTQKLGVLYAPSDAKYAKRIGDEGNLCATLIEQLPQKSNVRQRFHEAFTNWLPFYWKNYNATVRYTYVFDDLENVSDYWSRMSSDCKQRLRKSTRELIVRETDDLRLMYDISTLTFTRQGRKHPFSYDLVQRLHAACRDHAGSRILVAEDKAGNIHACDYLIYDSRCAISILQGADPAYRKGGAQRLLDWESINFASTVCQRFDFEGSVLPGVEPYNRGFGALQAPYFEIWKAGKSRRFGFSAPRRSIVAALRSLANKLE